MSLVVQHLTKLYGKQKAIEDISFSVKKGEIVGFLGPNGAGKSSTIKIITGCLPASEGRVTIHDFDIVDQPLAAKKIIGYLPEHNPLYLDMYVREYLNFVGHLYGINKSQRTHRIVEIMERCGLTPEQGKKLGMLSKGYKQRVGLAQALIHNPKVLILDEPTSGLDPNQIVEIRNMIKEISREKTVLFSTHIIQEAQALCNRVVILNKGKIVADDNIDTLTQQVSTGQVLVVQFRDNTTSEELSKLAGMKKVTSISDRHFRCFAEPDTDLRDMLFRYAANSQHTLIEMQEETTEMESVFQELTSKADHD